MNFADYIVEDMSYGPDLPSTDAYSQQDSHLPHPPTFDFDELLFFALLQIQALEQPIRNDWAESRWSGGTWEYEEDIVRPESHWGATETGFCPNPWEHSPPTSVDTCTVNSSFFGLRNELSPNIPDEAIPRYGVHFPDLYQQPTEPSGNEPPLVCTTDSKQGLQSETNIVGIPRDGLALQASSSEASCAEALCPWMTQGTSSRPIFLPSMSPLHSIQQLAKMRLDQEVQAHSSLDPRDSGACPGLPSSPKAYSLSAEPSLYKGVIQSSASPHPTPLEISNMDPPPATPEFRNTESEHLPHNRVAARYQPSLSETTHQALRSASGNLPCTSEVTYSRKRPCTSEVTYSRKRRSSTSHKCSLSEATNSKPSRKRKPRGPTNSKRSISQKMENQLINWGFKRVEGHLVCPCGTQFTRRWDAGRHWMSASLHKAERSKSGDFSDSANHRCDGCGEVLSRRDALDRHRQNCGQRKKRHYPGGWNPNSTVQIQCEVTLEGSLG